MSLVDSIQAINNRVDKINEIKKNGLDGFDFSKDMPPYWNLYVNRNPDI